VQLNVMDVSIAIAQNRVDTFEDVMASFFLWPNAIAEEAGLQPPKA
jgi:hypothetical protein